MKFYDTSGWSMFHKEDNGYWSERGDETKAIQVIEGEDGWYIHAHVYGVPNSESKTHGPYRSLSKAKGYAKRHRDNTEFWNEAEEPEPEKKD